MSLPKIHGIIAYPVTPFATDATGAIDTAQLTALVDRLVGGGVHAIAPLGSNGVLAYLDEAELDAVVDTRSRRSSAGYPSSLACQI